MPMHHVVVRWIAWRWAIGPGQERLSPAGRPSPMPAHGRGAVPVVVPSPAHITEPVLRHTALGQCSRDGLHATCAGTGSSCETRSAPARRPGLWTYRVT